MALTDDRVFYVWGEFYKQSFSIPTETMFKSFNEIFAHYFNQNFELSEEIIEFSDLCFRNDFYERYYDEFEKIGEGFYGEVVKVSHRYNPEICHAIKKIAMGERFKIDILREIQNLYFVRKLHEKYAVNHFDVWIEKNTYSDKLILFIEMDLCDKTLKQIIDIMRSDAKFIDRDLLTPIGYNIARQLFIEILESVEYLHQNNIIHRDLSPYNIMLKIPKNFDGFIKIVDFGLMALHEYAEQSHTQDRGNIRYAAPEVLDGKKYDTKADIYSLGRILGELFYLDYTIYEYKKLNQVLNTVITLSH
jgi:serine/threonine protein kinase